jgi:hypothetical protein
VDPGNSKRGGRESFGKNPYTDIWKIYDMPTPYQTQNRYSIYSLKYSYKWTIMKKVMILSTS